MQMTLIQQTFKKYDFAGGKRKKLPIFFASLIPLFSASPSPINFWYKKKIQTPLVHPPQPPVQNPTPASRPRPSLEKRKELSVMSPPSTLEVSRPPES